MKQAKKRPLILAIANQKGGVGKTTTAINLSFFLSELGKKVLLIDFDPQSNVGNCLGIELNPTMPQTMNILRFKDSFIQPIENIEEAIQTKYGFDIIPTKRPLTQADVMSSGMVGREKLLKNSLDKIKGLDKYDFVFIDCPPAPGFLNNTAFFAADGLIVTVQAEFLALSAFKTVLDTHNVLKEEYGDDYKTEIFGILVTMADERLRIARDTLGIVSERFPEKIFKTVIRRNVSIAEAPAHHLPIGLYKPICPGSVDYGALANEVLLREALFRNV